MPDNSTQSSTLSLTPLGAGDLIDRAIRLYRNNFWTFVWIASPPIILGTIITVGWTMFVDGMFASTSNKYDDYFFAAILKWFGGVIILIIEGIAMLIVMGGASRNFVRHLLFGEPITVKETYSNVWKRLGGLFVASTLLSLFLSFVGWTIFYIGILLLVFAVALVALALNSIPFLATIFSIIIGLAIAFGTGWLFFLIASRFAYVPQVMLVEGQGVFSAIGRSASLASGNVKRIYALFVFTVLATYAALLLFYIPLQWYAYVNGIETFSFGQNELPAWYTIIYQVIFQFSLILLMPVWMIGLCLLYVDERVRHEGYDIELMAARRLGEIPAVPQQFRNPLQPALATAGQMPPPQPPRKNSSLTTLGLD